MLAISTPSTTPSAVPAESARPGSSVWTCTFSADGSPTTRSESPDRLERRLERGLVEPLALDDEHGAVAVLRELLVDRVERQRLSLHRRVGQRLARELERKPARRSRPARRRPRRRRRPSRRTSSISGVRASASSPRASDGGEELVRLAGGGSPAARPPRPSRGSTVSIVPSTGRLTARYAASLAPRNARRRRGVARVLVLAEHVGEAAHDLREDDARSCRARP